MIKVIDGLLDSGTGSRLERLRETGKRLTSKQFNVKYIDEHVHKVENRRTKLSKPVRNCLNFYKCG